VCAGGSSIPDEGGVLRPDEDKQTHAHQLLRRQQDVLVVPGDVLLELGRPQLLIGGAGGAGGWLRCGGRG